jgi:hypothetical protein
MIVIFLIKQQLTAMLKVNTVRFSIVLMLLHLGCLCSCKDVNDYNITEVTSGGIDATIVLPNGQEVNDVNVKLYDDFLISSFAITTQPLERITTSLKGHATFEGYAVGNYTLIVDSIRYENKRYRVVKYIKVSSCVTKKVLINIEDYTSKIKVALSKYGATGSVLEKNANILIIPRDLANKYSNVNDLRKVAVASLLTNDFGNCYADVPACQIYSIYLCRLNSSVKLKLGECFVEPGQTLNTGFVFSPYDLK